MNNYIDNYNNNSYYLIIKLIINIIIKYKCI